MENKEQRNKGIKEQMNKGTKDQRNMIIKHLTLFNSLAIYTDGTFVNVTLVEAVSSGSGPALV